MKIALFHPQIPANTGNIARTCVVTNTELILVRPLGFSIDDKAIQRAGLDYWSEVKISTIDDLFGYLNKSPHPFYFFSSHAKIRYTDAFYTQHTTLIFGSEIAGLPSVFHTNWPDRFVTIPMQENRRCLNLATAVGIGLYGALSQLCFPF